MQEDSLKKLLEIPDNAEEIFFSINNPIFYSIFIVGVLVFLVFYVVKVVIIPRMEQHEKEKKNLEHKYTTSMALLAETAPDPVIRINKFGMVIFANKSGKALLDNKLEKPLFAILPEFGEYNLEKFIEKENYITLEKIIHDSHYTIISKGVKDLGAIQIYLYDVTKLKNYEGELEDSKIKLESLSNHLQSILEVERSRISKELHDGIGQTLSFIRLKIEDLKNGDVPKDQEKEIRDFLNSAITDAISELKSISYDLKPRMLEVHGLIPSLKMMVEQITQKSNMDGNFESYDVFDLPPKLEITVYRLCQECVNNIVKHSKANYFSVQLSILNDTLKIFIEDDGVGFNQEKVIARKKPGLGLVSLKERVEAFDGSLIMDSSEGNGTVVMIDFPLKQENPEEEIVD